MLDQGCVYVYGPVGDVVYVTMCVDLCVYCVFVVCMIMCCGLRGLYDQCTHVCIGMTVHVLTYMCARGVGACWV